jgi:hypothetical protein
MGRLAAPALAAPVLAALLVAAAGCGSNTKTTASAPSTGAAPVATAPAKTPTTSGATSGSTAGLPVAPSGGSESPAARTAPEPAFTSKPPQSEGAVGAAAIVRRLGYTPVDTSEYHVSQTLHALVGRRSGAGGEHSQRAFFFVNGRYIGTDSSVPSGNLSIASQGDTEVTLAYSLYYPSDQLCCPGAGKTRVRFQLNNGKLVALDPIPAVTNSARMLSRR